MKRVPSRLLVEAAHFDVTDQVDSPLFVTIVNKYAMRITLKL